MTAAILSGVVKRYGAVPALDHVDLDVARGDVLALLGPNGAGKTTALNVLLGLRRPDSGYVRLHGGDPRDPATRSAIGVTPQETSFPATLRVAEIVDLVRAHYRRAQDPGLLLERFDLTDLASRQAGGLSGGQRRRLACALAFVGRPETVFLDEPTTGLDVRARRSLWAAVREFVAEGGTVLLTTHQLEEVEALATRIVVIVSGRIVADGSPEDIRRGVGMTRIRLRTDAIAPPACERVEWDGDRATLYTREPATVVRWLVARDDTLRELEVQPAPLEEAFLRLTDKAE